MVLLLDHGHGDRRDCKDIRDMKKRPIPDFPSLASLLTRAVAIPPPTVTEPPRPADLPPRLMRFRPGP
jgi:hypothetical protein